MQCRSLNRERQYYKSPRHPEQRRRSVIQDRLSEYVSVQGVCFNFILIVSRFLMSLRPLAMTLAGETTFFLTEPTLSLI